MNNPDDLPIFRPRMGGGPRRSASGGFRNEVLSRGFRMGALRTKPERAMRAAVVPPTAQSRRVVVKAHFSKMTKRGAAAAALHLAYIQRDGVERDGSKGVLYDGEGVARAESFGQPREGEKNQFRFIVAPEDGDELDLTLFVRRFMTRVERDLGKKLEWAAVNHMDTDHPHAHIVVRGIDRDGNQVRFDRGYVARGLRWRAQEIATEELGPRCEIDIQRTLRREVTQERFTSLDRDIERLVSENDHVVVKGNSLLKARLEHLERMRIADRTGASSWQLAEGWQSQLRELGMRGDIIKQMHKVMAGDPSRYRIVGKGDTAEIVGRVAAKGLADEAKGSFFAIIEQKDGRAYHVPMDVRSAQSISVGDQVVFSNHRIRKLDSELSKHQTPGRSGL